MPIGVRARPALTERPESQFAAEPEPHWPAALVAHVVLGLHGDTEVAGQLGHVQNAAKPLSSEPGMSCRRLIAVSR